MTDDFFAAAETAPLGFAAAADKVLASLRFDRDGLIPVIAQCARSGETLMLAWMSRESLALTMRSGRMTYWSRSRPRLVGKRRNIGLPPNLAPPASRLRRRLPAGRSRATRRRLPQRPALVFYVEWRGESFVVVAAPANKEGRALGDSNL